MRLVFLVPICLLGSCAAKEENIKFNHLYVSDSDQARISAISQALTELQIRLNRQAQVKMDIFTIPCNFDDLAKENPNFKECHILDGKSKNAHILQIIITNPDEEKSTQNMEISSAMPISAVQRKLIDLLSLALNEDISVFHEDMVDAENFNPFTAVDFYQRQLNEIRQKNCENCNLQELDEETFHQFISSGHKPAILFWQQDDITCEYFFQLLHNISPETRMASLACHNHQKICEEFDLTELPQLIMFDAEGKVLKNYQGQLTENAVMDWLTMLKSDDYLTELNPESVIPFKNGRLRDFPNEIRPAVTIGMFASSTEPAYKAYVSLAKELHGRYHLGAMVNADVARWAHHPALITFRPINHYELIRTLHSNMDYNSMLNFIVESSKRNVLIIDELTLPELISSNIPLLILVEKPGSAQSAGSLLDHFHQLAANSSIKGRVNFASYEVADNFLGKILLTKWKLRKSLLPALILMYLPKCSVFVKYTDDKIKKKDLINWVDDTLKRPQTAHTHIRELERDFRNELPKPGNTKTSAKVTDEL